METVSGDRRGKESAGARERLMDAAYAEILAGHWGARRMIDISAAAGVSRQTLYNVFGSKEGLLQSVVVREATALMDTVERVLEAEGHDPAHAVGRATRMVLVAAGKDPLLRAMVTGDDELLPVLTTRSEPLMDTLGERIRRSLRERCPETDPGAIEAAADVALRLAVSYSLQPIDPERASHRVELVVNGVLSAGH